MATRMEARRDGTAPLPWLAAAALLATLAVNALAVYLPLGGRTTGAISDMYPVLVTPAGFAFSVWSVIYAGLVAFVAYGASSRGRGERRVERLWVPFIATCVFNVAWLFAWHFLYVGLSLAFMVALFAGLVVAYRRIGPAFGADDAAFTAFVRTPFGLYLGWIAVATIVNARVVAYELGWQGGGATEVAATVLAILGVAAVSLWLLARRRDLAFAAVAAWALMGIYAANGQAPVVAGGAIAGAGLVVVGAIAAVLRGRVRGRDG